jgi:hypothetical protein
MIDTKELDAAIDVAMTESGGDTEQAAKLIGIERSALQNRLKASRILRERWVDKLTEMPKTSVAIHRPPLDPPASEEELDAAMSKQDALVRRGIERMGFSGPTLDLAISLQSFQRRHFMSSLDLMGGGLVKQYLDIMVEIDRLNKLINQDIPDISPDKDPSELEEVLNGLTDLERIRREDRSRLLAIQVQMYDRVNKAALTQALIKAKQGAKNGSKPRGFLAIQAQPGSQVAVQVGEGAEE